MMQNKKTILIGDNSMDLGVACGDLLVKMGYNVTLVPRDGNKVLDGIKNIAPNVVVVESFMAQFDAIAVMKKVRHSMTVKPSFIVISGYDNKVIEKDILDNGASHYMLKPIDPHELCERICALSSCSDDNTISPDTSIAASDDLETIVTEVILNIGVPAHVKGYHYIRYSIMLCVKEQNLINSVTKVLYPTVAKQYDTTSSRVERAIRHAIEIAWDRGDVDVLNSYFGFTVNTSRGKPTNSEFIAMISDRLRLQIKRENKNIL